MADANRWNHNIHYYPVILRLLPLGAGRALDVGCGEGMLARQLRMSVPQVSAIDADEHSIDLARRQDPTGQIDFILGDFLSHPFPPAAFDLITCVAALHHMDPAAALRRMAWLLRPGGTLAVIGCARSRLPADLPWEIAAALTHGFHRLTKQDWHHPAPTLWPPPHTHAEIRRLAYRLLPAAQYRRRLLWRYSLTWTTACNAP